MSHFPIDTALPPTDLRIQPNALGEHTNIFAGLAPNHVAHHCVGSPWQRKKLSWRQAGCRTRAAHVGIARYQKQARGRPWPIVQPPQGRGLSVLHLPAKHIAVALCK